MYTMTKKGEVLKRIESGEIEITACFDDMWCIAFEGRTAFLSAKDCPDRESVERVLIDTGVVALKHLMVKNQPFGRFRL